MQRSVLFVYLIIINIGKNKDKIIYRNDKMKNKFNIKYRTSIAYHANTYTTTDITCTTGTGTTTNFYVMEVI